MEARAEGYACPDCGSCLRQDPIKKPGYLYCHCGFHRKTLKELDKEVPEKRVKEDPLKRKR